MFSQAFSRFTKLEIYLHDTLDGIYETGVVRLNVLLRIKHYFYYDCEFFKVTIFKHLGYALIPTAGII